MQEIFWPAINEQSDDSRIGWNFDDYCWSPFSRPIHFTRGLFLECYSLLTLCASDILLLSLLFPVFSGKKGQEKKSKERENAREAECRFARRWSPFQFIPCGRRRTIARALFLFFELPLGFVRWQGSVKFVPLKAPRKGHAPPQSVLAKNSNLFENGRPVKETDYWTRRFWVYFTLFVHFLYTRLSMYGGKESNYRQVPWFRSWVLLNWLKEAICIAGNIWQQRVHSTPQLRPQAATAT